MGKKYSVAERAYLAGFLDADGCVMATIERHKEKKFGFRVKVSLKVSQSNRDVLDWFHSRFKVGYIRKNRTCFDWVIRDQKLAGKLLLEVAPYLKVKKRQAVIARKILKTGDASRKALLKQARLADSLSSFNVRSKGRRKNYSSMIEEYFSRND